MKYPSNTLLKIVVLAAALSVPASMSYARSVGSLAANPGKETRAVVPDCDDLSDKELKTATDGCMSDLLAWCNAVGGGMSTEPGGNVCTTKD